jgi:hypothetical protein
MAETIKPGKIRFQSLVGECLLGDSLLGESLLGESLLGDSLLGESEAVILRLLKSQSGKSTVRSGDIGS